MSDSGFFEKVKLLDMFGKPVTLNVFGKKRHKTIVGAFVTLCSVVFFISVIQNRLVNFILNEDIIAQQHVLQEQASELSINPSTLMMAIKFDIAQGAQNIEGQPFTFKISQVEQNLIHQTQSTRMQIITKNITTGMEPCTLEHFSSQQKSEMKTLLTFFQDYGVQSYYCPNIELNFTLQGNRNTELYKYILIEIISCEDQPGCWTKKQINDYIQNYEYFTIQVIFNSYIPNYDSQDYLKSYIYDKKIFRMIPYSMKPIAEMYFEQNNIESDESWFWFSSSRFESYVMYSEEEFRENLISQTQTATSLKNYGQFYFLRSQYTINTQRAYEKIDGILSYMGGFIQMVFVLTGFIMEFYNMQSLMIQLANQLYSFETPTELKNEDKDILQFHTKQDFLRSIYSKIFSQVEKLSINIKYFIYKISFRRLFNNGRNVLIHEVMKQVDKDLNIFEILDRLHEVDKMKKVLFTEEQKKIFEFSYKPTFNLESIQNNMKVRKIQEIEQKRIKRNKKIRDKEEKKLQKKIQSQILSQRKLCLNSQKEILANKNIPLQTSNQVEAYDKNNLSKKSFVDIVAQIQYLKNQDNLNRICQISNLLLEEGQIAQNQNQMTLNLSSRPDKFTETFYCFNNLSNQNYHNNYQTTFNNINQFHSQQISPLKQYLLQNKRKKNDNFLLNLIQVLRPQTFYSQRMDYSQFSAFYELYEAYEQATNPQLNNRNQIKVTQKILQFLGQDIRDVFKLAEKLPTEESILRQERINMLVQLFIHNLKQKTGKESLYCLTKVNEEVSENEQKGFDIQSNYQFRINKMNQLNEKTDQLLRGKNTQSLINSSNLSSINQNPETLITVLDQSSNNPKYIDRSNNAMLNKQDFDNLSQISPTRFSQNSPNKNSSMKKLNEYNSIQNNKGKRFSLQFQYIPSDKHGITQNQTTGVKTNSNSSIFRSNFQQQKQPKSIVELSKFDQNATSQSSDEIHNIYKPNQTSSSHHNIDKALKNVKFQLTINEDQAEQVHSFNNIKINNVEQNNQNEQ
ncbi:transmembrane protein, putative (macronuclear) [Tetrahymena thermophila SB210]|uniref:Transmembrane protein, putative n=1 Tax=Tetrahymena thermophila (strain SB210) TaxID=312017 RepID=I7MG94_TETTS|nr:transmembrane protein, putative [Tetrahymena thermophila SB210]EAR84940.2 transmembrane protein, putative [Tetrahymena thermophila SB210]|eukprot:XP_001032603.2 transmembrane protein, putative [Tetrahymena thermophila SB210]